MKITKSTIMRALWTGAEAVAGLAIAFFTSISSWWAAPIALFLAGVKVHFLDTHVAEEAPDQ